MQCRGFRCEYCGHDLLASPLLRAPDERFTDVALPFSTGLLALDVRGLQPVDVSAMLLRPWGLFVAAPTASRVAGLRSLLSSVRGEVLLVALVQEFGLDVLVDLLAGPEPSCWLSPFADALPRSLVALEHTPLAESSRWSGTSRLLLGSFLGLLPDEEIRGEIPLSLLLDGGYRGIGACACRVLDDGLTGIPEDSHEEFAALLPEWTGTLATLLDAVRCLA